MKISSSLSLFLWEGQKACEFFSNLLDSLWNFEKVPVKNVKEVRVLKGREKKKQNKESLKTG